MDYIFVSAFLPDKLVEKFLFVHRARDPLESVSNPCSYHVILHGPVPGAAEADVAEVPGAARLDPRVPGHVEGLDQRHPVPGRPERVEVEVIQELRHAALTEHLHSHTASAQIYQSLKMNYDS